MSTDLSGEVRRCRTLRDHFPPQGPRLELAGAVVRVCDDVTPATLRVVLEAVHQHVADNP